MSISSRRRDGDMLQMETSDGRSSAPPAVECSRKHGLRHTRDITHVWLHVPCRKFPFLSIIRLRLERKVALCVTNKIGRPLLGLSSFFHTIVKMNAATFKSRGFNVDCTDGEISNTTEYPDTEEINWTKAREFLTLQTVRHWRYYLDLMLTKAFSNLMMS